MNEQILKFKYEEVIIIWQTFCELHSSLYDLTCEEYMHLLASDIESLETTLIQKDKVLADIRSIEVSRQELIEEINKKQLAKKVVTNISDLMELMSSIEISHNSENRLEKFNMLLIDIIEKIQEQNKMNQVFLNKAIISLRDIRESFNGEKNYKTYGANGFASKNLSR